MPLNQDNTNIHLFNIQPAKKLGMNHGWLWINEGFRYFTYSKMNWLTTIFTLVLSIMLLIKFVPIIQLFLIILMPLITAGLGLGCYEIERGKQVNVSYLIKGFFHPNNANLVRYGFWLILLMIVAQMIGSTILMTMGVSQEAVASELQRLGQSKNPTFESIMASPVLVKYFSISMIMMLPIAALNLLAPYLLIFSRLTALESIKYCIVAVIKNINAIVVYALIYLVLITVLVFLLNAINGILFSVFSTDSLIASSIDLVITILSIMFIAALSYCSAYVAFKDISLGEEI